MTSTKVQQYLIVWVTTILLSVLVLCQQNQIMSTTDLKGDRKVCTSKKKNELTCENPGFGSVWTP